MAMGTRKRRERQEGFWYRGDLAEAPGHPFYKRLNDLLEQADFDRFCEGRCERFYHEKLERPSLALGMYFRLLLIGFFEGIESERGIAWRVADSLCLREFLQIGLDERTPDHVTLSRTRRLIDEEGYTEYLKRLAKAAGVEAHDETALRRMDRRRKKKARNEEWVNPHDPEAEVTRMKDGRTALAYKAEHARGHGHGSNRSCDHARRRGGRYRVGGGDAATGGRSRRRTDRRIDRRWPVQGECEGCGRVGRRQGLPLWGCAGENADPERAELHCRTRSRTPQVGGKTSRAGSRLPESTAHPRKSWQAVTPASGRAGRVNLRARL